ncbi:MAG: 6,7-dimethyl-8-ribityllumazine synthase [Phycisphaeraceae bacterium]|nr:6,7-dimethyl-8-ribityllumazine synthase [Phycisphaeraceae bacterium]
MASRKGPVKKAGREDSPRIAVVVSRYNATVTDRLVLGAIETTVRRTGRTPEVFDAPGAFELPVLCDTVARSGRFSGVVALGCLIRGETIHDRVIADSVAGAIQNSMLKTGVPIAFGVLTVENAAQARARAGGKHGNKGSEAVEALLDTIESLSAIRDASTTRIGRKLPDKTKPRAGMKPVARRRKG